ncbi:VanZ family protein [Ornithinibacillus scapharcae]|uniref:VanZ family protein n=1 Tax=Ornithinibacillus scapharcae TaxID=1147159 RepID=UPI001ED978D5|nr:VanZ family protein [Ornithinibacillus scapharcae]
MECLLYLTLYPTSADIPNNVSVNLVPFKTIHLYIKFEGNIMLQIINLLGNVVVFIPIGLFALSLMRRVTLLIIFIIGLGSTLFIEFMQLILSITGIISRSFDVDDLILNTLGVLIGYIIGVIGKKLTLLKAATVR